MINNLVVNGCSYMNMYARGRGYADLASRLDITNSESIAVSGSANTRILRTTMKHSYTAPPTLYVLGMTFLSRWELPIAEPQNEFEGRWCNAQNQDVRQRWQHGWSDQDVQQLIEIKLKSEVFSIADRLEDLMHRINAVIDSLLSRGHRALVFQTADDLHLPYINSPQFDLFKRPEIINGYQWRSIAWQSQQGVPSATYSATDPFVPPEIRHAAPGQHQLLNEYLTNYIKENKILS